jgi:hypothetical protein
MGSANINDTRHWYHRAAEMRALADEMRDVESQAIMFRLAADYDKLADRAAKQAGGIPPKGQGSHPRQH